MAFADLDETYIENGEKYLELVYDKDYINKIRIEEAKRLLDQNKFQINEIAFKVGFGHISSFNRVFKISEQITPGEYIAKKLEK